MTISAGHRITIAQQGGRPQRPVAFHQLKLLQVWQDWSLDRVMDLCWELGYTGLLVKALDGGDWMERFDPEHDAVGSLEELQNQCARARARGLYYFAWTNPRPSGERELAAQATLAGQIARSCDGVFLDVEPYAQFWGANNPPGLASQYMRWIRGEAPAAWLCLQPDPRPARLGEIRVWEWLEHCDALSGQHYWSDFGTKSWDELAYAAELGDVYGVTNLPTLPGNAGLETFPIDRIEQLPGFVVWRYGNTPERTLMALGGSRIAGYTSARIRGR